MEAWEIANIKKQQIQTEDNRLYLEIPYELHTDKLPAPNIERSVIVLENTEPDDTYMGIYDRVI